MNGFLFENEVSFILLLICCLLSIDMLNLLNRVSFAASQTKKSFRGDIIFFGSDKVAYPSLRALNEAYSNVKVVTYRTNSDRKLTNDIQLHCREQNIPYTTPIGEKKDRIKRKREWDEYQGQLVKYSRPCLGIICSYGFMIPDNVIDSFEEGMLVVHPSLVPKFRGGAPIFHAIANGQIQSGVSFIQVTKDKFDEGDILKQVKCHLPPQATYEQVEKLLAEQAGQNIVDILENLKTLRPGTPQCHLESSIDSALIKAPIVRTKTININQSAKKVFDWSRALQKPRVIFEGRQIIVHFNNNIKSAQQLQVKQEMPTGSLIKYGKKLYMKCFDDFIQLKGWHQLDKKQLPMYTFVDRFMKNNASVKLQ